MVISSAAATAARTEEDTAEAASLKDEAEEERPSWKLGWLANDLGE